MKEEKKKKIPGWAILIIVLVSIFMVLPVLVFIGITAYFIFSDYDETGIVEEGSYTIIDDSFKLDNTTVKGFYDKESDTYYITGTIKNTLEDESRNYVNISYNVYDKDGDLLGTANAYIDNLGKGQTWKFKAYYSDIDSKDVVSYKLDKVEHYNDF